MRVIALICLLGVAGISACDVRSDTAKREMEKFNETPSPTPPPAPTPVETPIEPADIVQVDTTLDGKLIELNGYEKKLSASCTKFDRIMIDGDQNTVTVKGGCKQIMINGDKNQVISDATVEFVVNGSENKATYARFVNGKHPMIKQNTPGNTVEKAGPATTKK